LGDADDADTDGRENISTCDCDCGAAALAAGSAMGASLTDDDNEATTEVRSPARWNSAIPRTMRENAFVAQRTSCVSALAFVSRVRALPPHLPPV
jgi:hypothetical protein